MNEEKKAAPDDYGIESGAGDQISVQTIGNPAPDSTTSNYRRQEISVLLPYGEENAVSTKELMHLTGCTSARMLQERISAEREHGSVILSCERGYFLPGAGNAGRQELRRFIQTMERRAAGTLRAAESAKAALASMEEVERCAKSR